MGKPETSQAKELSPCTFYLIHSQREGFGAEELTWHLLIPFCPLSVGFLSPMLSHPPLGAGSGSWRRERKPRGPGSRSRRVMGGVEPGWGAWKPWGNPSGDTYGPRGTSWTAMHCRKNRRSTVCIELIYPLLNVSWILWPFRIGQIQVSLAVAYRNPVFWAATLAIPSPGINVSGKETTTPH